MSDTLQTGEVYRFTTMETEQIIATVREYKGRYYADLRVYFQPDGEAEFHPSKKGITIAADLVPELVHAVAALAASLRPVITKGDSRVTALLVGIFPSLGCSVGRNRITRLDLTHRHRHSPLQFRSSSPVLR